MATEPTTSNRSKAHNPTVMQGRFLGETLTGPIYLTPTVLAVAPAKIAFENLAELGLRAINPDAKVVGTIANRHKGEGAFFAHLVFTGLAVGSLRAMSLPMRQTQFWELYKFLLIKGDATGLESLYLSAWQSVWSSLQAIEQRRAADLWNYLARNASVAQKFGVIGYDGATSAIVPILPIEIQNAGLLSPSQSNPWNGGFDPGGNAIGVGSEGLPGSSFGFGSQPGGSMGLGAGVPGDPSGLPGSSSSPGSSPGGVSSRGSGAPGVTGGLPGSSSGFAAVGAGKAGETGEQPGSSFGATLRVGGTGGGIIDQNPKGPLGGIISNINSRADAGETAKEGAAEAKIGASEIALGAICVGAGIGLAPATEGISLLLSAFGAGLAVAGFIGVREGANKEAHGKFPPDILRELFNYAAAVTGKSDNTVYAISSGHGGDATEAGIQLVTTELLTGAGLAAFMITTDKGYIHLPTGLLSPG